MTVATVKGGRLYGVAIPGKKESRPTRRLPARPAIEQARTSAR
uniref:Uncharacterized protein n=1 Tax=Candidatus Kentrum sp. FM TaxID=2126340 RepID=A0A450TX45_9GAMM|nr:MAG: hypothetical protein BECKFM1743C_GA0114222_100268 [Candidatus Kentron sp. FM]VFJ73762.1 MAG: hypothetical protein BECKFM1743A_GA0114220_107391 [Candidatus Kentron sp. FM]VFK20771.1 MAG: hypothetical protein BECKFM1743B_GA0114221_107261 [Candidatus Kentron sp. FM]